VHSLEPLLLGLQNLLFKGGFTKGLLQEPFSIGKPVFFGSRGLLFLTGRAGEGLWELSPARRFFAAC
jgi:hypothetical protein